MSPNAISVIWSSWNWQDYHCGGVYSTGITKTIAIFREEVTSALAGFHEGRLSRWNWNLEMLVFVEGFYAENLEKKKTLGATREPITNSTQIWHRVEIEPRPYWWEASNLNTASSLSAPLRRENGEFSR